MTDVYTLRRTSENLLGGMRTAIVLMIDEEGPTHLNDLAANAKKPGENRRARKNRVFKCVDEMIEDGLVYRKGALVCLTGRGHAAVAAWRAAKAAEQENRDDASC